MKASRFALVFVHCLLSYFSFGQKPELVLPIGHTESVISVTYSPDSKYIVTTSDDKTAKIWDARTGKLLRTFLDGEFKNLSFSPDGKRILYSRDSTAKIVDVYNGKIVYSFKEKKYHDINILSYCPDGRSVVTTTLENDAKIWDAQTGKLIRSLVHGAKDQIKAAVFSSDSKSIVTTNDSTARIWDWQSGKLLHTLTVPRAKLKTWDGNSYPNYARNVSYSPDSKKVVITSGGKPPQVWSVQGEQVVCSLNGSDIDKVQFSPDGKSIFTVTGGVPSIVQTWDAQNGKLLFTLDQSWTSSLTNFSYSPDGKSVAITCHDTIKIWDSQSGKLTLALAHESGANRIKWSPDGKTIVVSASNTAQLWDAQRGTLLLILEGQTDNIESADHSPDSKNIVLTTSNTNSKILDLQTGKLLHSLQESGKLIHAGYSPDGKNIVTSSWTEIEIEDPNTLWRNKNYFGIFKLWDSQTGKMIFGLDPMAEGQQVETINFLDPMVSYSPDGKTLAAAYGNHVTAIRDAQKINLLYRLRGDLATYSPDGKTIATACEDTVKIWSASTTKLLYSLSAHTGKIKSLCFSPDSKSLVTTSSDGSARQVWQRNDSSLYTTGLDHNVTAWDVQNGKLIGTLHGQSEYRGGGEGALTLAIYSPDGKTILTGARDGIAKIYDAQTGKLLRSLGASGIIKGARYSPDSKIIITSSLDVSSIYEHVTQDNITRVWDATTGNLISTIEHVTLIDILWPDKKIVATNNSMIYLFDLETGKEIVRWLAVGKEDWVVLHSSGLFDASPGAMDKLYFVLGLDVIDLKQLKARYYEPGLWKKIMGGEKLRNVVGFNDVELPPDIRVGQVDNKGNLPVEIINRGGGIGEVTLYINGKEVIKDLRTKGADTKSPTLSFSIPVSSNKNLIAGEENYLAVKAWNAKQWIESKGTIVTYTPPTKSEIKPAIHIIVCGVSDYTGDEIDLKYAAKDAEDMSKALELGAKKLFGTDKSYVYTLTTNQKQNFYPTKTNILNVFEKVSTTASSADVMVVYLSGHGINLGGSDGDFHYLTQEAYSASTSAYNDPAILRQTTLSSQELVELFKKVPALKQVLMIDACASGKLVDNLITKRDIESTTLRALDRMKDRTGMHIITGCAADAVSYEASKYGQGILTYSLLEGLRGLALREDKFVDVNKLFQFAQERVPVLASGIGGIQSPEVFSPNGSQSFDFGELTSEDKKQIPIAKERPIYIRSNFIDEQKLRDVLGLGKKMDEILNDVSAKGEASPLFFVDVSEYPDGCQLSGLYRQVEGKIIFRLNKACEGKEGSSTLEAKDEKELLGKILDLLNK